ncbi:MAG: hypothetical protein DRG35_06235 [Deltaproteobacteria bacterium]|nr:hypothetical protein [Deltaproteobacteria bacterium]MCD6265989.1 hypothetical protein [Deltaproteobacteria bacterium]RLB13854.1 MAG: hypothetical protein DRG35_06235 [Deltaproteobacteria bacterium]
MSYHNISRGERVRTTIDIPQRLWERLKATIKNRDIKSQNTFLIQALEAYLEQLEEAWIDQEFARMESDEIYKSLNLQIADEFAHSDWEALQSDEKKS